MRSTPIKQPDDCHVAPCCFVRSPTNKSADFNSDVATDTYLRALYFARTDKCHCHCSKKRMPAQASNATKKAFYRMKLRRLTTCFPMVLKGGPINALQSVTFDSIS
ncbi:hypothetical protein TRVL_04482 [Trypanosoma vivax]|nr:hypothetical protein TRVL_04482 [Trypanosoma vivax]